MGDANGFFPGIFFGAYAVRHSEFWDRVEYEFGSIYGRQLTKDLVITTLSDRTAEQSLADGESPRIVWEAICVQVGLERHSWYRFDPRADRR